MPIQSNPKPPYLAQCRRQTIDLAAAGHRPNELGRVINFQAIGRSRSSLTMKIHVKANVSGNSIGFYLTPGQSHDLEGGDVLLKGTPAAAMVIADKALNAQAW